MKWTIEIDCTPEEARRFMGMPDVSELHKEMFAKMQENFANMDAESMMKYWMPFMQTGNMDQMTDMWQKMMKASFDFGSNSDKS